MSLRLLDRCHRAFCASAVLVLAASANAAPPTEPPLLPRPASLVLQPGSLVLPTALPLHVPDGAEHAAIAARLVAHAAKACGRTLVPATSADGIALRLERDGARDAARGEAYRFDVDARGLRVSAADVAGLRHGASTALQLLCNGDELPWLRIDDRPQFAWRGVMLDSARHYQSPRWIRRFLDTMALHKLNVLHWHLTDDQAWRLEIRKYPKLTEVGGWRVPAGAAAQSDIDPATGAPRRIGGWYSQQEVRDLVAYAAALGIDIVPEIEMPGHASAAIAAYPELGARRGAVTDVPADWGIYPNAFALDEATFVFLEDVLRETMELFPSRYVHVGGDEVEPAQWLASEAGKALARELGSSDGHALQARFTQRIARFVAANGRRLVGWDEILAPGLADGAVVMSWRGIDGAIAAAAKGHDTVLSPWPTLYFDNRQGDAPDEPPGRIATIALRDVYAFDPLPAAIADGARRHVLGLQGAVWTEHIRTEERVGHMAFPRAAAVAELGWTPAARRDYEAFVRRLASVFPHYAALGIDAADSVFAPRFEVRRGDDGVRLAIANEAGLGSLHFTTDGSAPDVRSPRYATPIEVAADAVVRAVTVVDGRVLGAERASIPAQRDARRRGSRSLALCAKNIPLLLEDDAPREGARAVFAIDIQQPCWKLDGIDLSQPGWFEARVGQVPFNFQIGAARDKIAFPTPRSGAGELLLLDASCEGEPLARLPLAEATASQATTELPRVDLPVRDHVDGVCLRFAQHGVDPLWALDEVRWGPR